MEGKKSFVLYADLKAVVDELPDELAGQLFKTVLDYVNDKNPEPENFAVKLAFIPIKQQLKRDLDQWELKREKRSQAGKASAAKRKQQKATKSTPVKSVKQKPTKATVNVNDTVNVNGTVNVTGTEIIYPFNTQGFFDLWEIWKHYKHKQHRFKYKTPISEQAALKKLSELAGGNEETAMQIIEQSISNGWAGFFALKGDKPKPRAAADSDYLNELKSRLS